MKTATFIQKLPNFRGDARLYRLNPPLEGYEYVVVSAVNILSIRETMVFGSDQEGNIADWLDLAVVYELNHKAALEKAGYSLAGEQK